MRLAVLASGTGSILQAIVETGITVDLVLVDRACLAASLADGLGLNAVIVERSGFGADFDRSAYSDEVVEALHDHEIEVIAMAGFGTILAPQFFDAFAGRVLNTHPALLPSFIGWHAVKAALDFGVKVTGCTVHLATPEVDAGPILAQEAVPVLDGDDETSLHERIKAVERRLYPDTIRAFLASCHPIEEIPS
ncbi:MAG: phosphoribosylglycinamide formyltransferase [Acidimicrobiales bacterium]